MVKHRRQAHREGGLLIDDGDDASVSELSDTPSTPQPSTVRWESNAPEDHFGMCHSLQGASSFPDLQRGGTFAGMTPQINVQPQYHESPQGYYGQHVHAQPHVVPSRGIPHYPHFVTEQSNPAVATMNTNPPTFQHVQGQLQAPSLSVRIPFNGVGMPASIQSSPSTFSAHSGHQSPPPQENMYDLAVNQAAPYTMHTISPAMGHTNVDHSQQPVHHTPEPMPSHALQHDSKQYHQPQVSHPEAPWMNKLPMQFMAMGVYASLGPGALNFMDLKDDTPAGVQMPSERIHELFL
jgi:hypothetical protein